MKMRRLTEQELQERDDLFLNILRRLQRKHKAYWIKASHIRKALFGVNDLTIGPQLYDRYLEYTKHVARTRLLYKKLEKAGKLQTKKHKIEGKGIAHVYLHTEHVQELQGFNFRGWFKSLSMEG